MFKYLQVLVLVIAWTRPPSFVWARDGPGTPILMNGTILCGPPDLPIEVAASTTDAAYKIYEEMGGFAAETVLQLTCDTGLAFEDGQSGLETICRNGTWTREMSAIPSCVVQSTQSCNEIPQNVKEGQELVLLEGEETSGEPPFPAGTNLGVRCVESHVQVRGETQKPEPEGRIQCLGGRWSENHWECTKKLDGKDLLQFLMARMMLQNQMMMGNRYRRR